jgi:hypothetical protein
MSYFTHTFSRTFINVFFEILKIGICIKTYLLIFDSAPHNPDQIIIFAMDPLKLNYRTSET